MSSLRKSNKKGKPQQQQQQTRPQKKSFWTKTRVAITLTALAATLAITLATLSRSAKRETENPAPLVTNTPGSQPATKPAVVVNTPAPTPAPTPDSAVVLNTALPSLDGGTFRLADYRGKVLVLNFWATWCGPCKMEVPHLVQMKKEYQGRGVEFVGLSTEDPASSRELVREFAREYGINYKLGFSDRQFANNLMGGRTNIPQVMVMRDGRVLTHFRGFSQETSPSRLRTAIEQAINTK